MELRHHTANRYGCPIVQLQFAYGRYWCTTGASMEEYFNAKPRMVSRKQAIALWPDANGAEVVTAITEARIPISLQELINHLIALPPDTVVRLDIGRYPNDVLYPYRGDYRDMSLSATDDADANTAGELAQRLTADIGHTRTGHKGDEALIHGQCGVWIAEYGEASCRGVKGVTPDGIIQTALMSGSRDIAAMSCPDCGGSGTVKA